MNQTPRMEQVLLQKHRDLEIHQSVLISGIMVDVPLPPVVQSTPSCAHVMFTLLSNLHIMLISEKCAKWKVPSPYPKNDQEI